MLTSLAFCRTARALSTGVLCSPSGHAEHGECWWPQLPQQRRERQTGRQDPQRLTERQMGRATETKAVTVCKHASLYTRCVSRMLHGVPGIPRLLRLDAGLQPVPNGTSGTLFPHRTCRGNPSSNKTLSPLSSVSEWARILLTLSGKTCPRVPALHAPGLLKKPTRFACSAHSAERGEGTKSLSK